MRFLAVKQIIIHAPIVFCLSEFLTMNTSLRTFRIYSFLVATILIQIGASSAIHAQEISPELNYRIKTAIARNYMMKTIYACWEQRFRDNPFHHLTPKDFQGWTLFDEIRFKYFGFGYMPGDLKIEITPMNLNYPDKAWKLYNVSFLDAPVQDTIASWYASKWYSPDQGFTTVAGGVWPLVAQKQIVVGVNHNMDIRFISGRRVVGFDHEISRDFKLKKNKPNSYIPFLNLKIFGSDATSSLLFLRKEQEKLVFAINSNSRSPFRSEYYMDNRWPDKEGVIKIKIVGALDSSVIKNLNANISIVDPDTRYKIPLGFPTLADKERYLKDALMRNLYMYRMHQLSDLPKRLNYDTLTGCLQNGASDFDQLLPDYDEYIGELELFRRYCCFAPGAPSECYDWYWSPIFESKGYINGNTRKLIGGTLLFNRIEFYAFIKSKKEVLYKRMDGSFNEIKEKLDPRWKKTTRKGKEVWYRYDTYYHPHLAKEEAPPAVINADKWYNNCSADRPVRTVYDDLSEPADFYLLGLDTFT